MNNGFRKSAIHCFCVVDRNVCSIYNETSSMGIFEDKHKICLNIIKFARIIEHEQNKKCKRQNIIIIKI